MKHNRRSFLKYQTIMGAGALTTGMIFPQACTSPDQHINSDLTSSEVLLAKYQECLGGPFPDPSSLNTQLRETIKNSVVRHEVAFMIVSSNQGGNG